MRGPSLNTFWIRGHMESTWLMGNTSFQIRSLLDFWVALNFAENHRVRLVVANGASLLHLWQEHFRKQPLPLVDSCFPGYLASSSSLLSLDHCKKNLK